MKRLVEYVRRQGVMVIAMGFIVASITLAVVSAIVYDLISPLIGLIIQTEKLDNLTFTIRHATFSYGHLLSVAIYLAAILAVLYIFFKKLRLDGPYLEEAGAKPLPAFRQQAAPQGPATPVSPRCSSCGAPIGTDSRFCNECGRPVESAPGVQLPGCPGCGITLVAGAVFCGECGTRI